MAEGLLTLTVMVLMIAVTLTTGIWQEKSIQMLANTTHKAFVFAKGDRQTQPRIQQLVEQRGLSNLQTSIADVSSPSIRLQVISKELGMNHDRVKVKQSGSFINIDQGQSIRFNRFTYIDSGAGHASSDRNVYQKISRSNLIWKQAYSVSRPITKSIGMTTAVVDKPWSRSSLDADWFSRWSGSVPESKLNRIRK